MPYSLCWTGSETLPNIVVSESITRKQESELHFWDTLRSSGKSEGVISVEGLLGWRCMSLESLDFAKHWCLDLLLMASYTLKRIHQRVGIDLAWVLKWRNIIYTRHG